MRMTHHYLVVTHVLLDVASTHLRVTVRQAAQCLQLHSIDGYRAIFCLTFRQDRKVTLHYVGTDVESNGCRQNAVPFHQSVIAKTYPRRELPQVVHAHQMELVQWSRIYGHAVQECERSAGEYFCSLLDFIIVSRARRNKQMIEFRLQFEKQRIARAVIARNLNFVPV